MCEACDAAQKRLSVVLRRHGVDGHVLSEIIQYARCPRHREGTNIIVLDDDGETD